MRGILRFAITMVMITTTVAFFVPVLLTTHKQSRRVGVMTMLGMFGKKSAGGNKKTFTVTVQQKFYKNAELEVEAGAPVNLRKELMKNKIDIYPLQGKIYNCGGGGQCGTCAIQIIKGAKNLNPKSPVEVKALGGKKGDDIRLACCTRASGDVTVKTKP